MSDLPVAVWSGEVFGVKVHVLDDGRRIVDADDLHTLFADDNVWQASDLADFAEAFKRFMAGETPGAFDENGNPRTTSDPHGSKP